MSTNHAAPDSTSPPLAVMVGGGKTITLASGAITIYPISIGMIPAFFDAAGPLLHLILAKDLDLFSFFIVNSERCLALLAVLSGLPREKVNALPPDEGLELLAEVLELNIDFLLLRVLPKLPGLTKMLATLNQKLVKAVPQGGPTKSNG